MRVLTGTIDARQAGHAYADLAETLVAALLAAARHEFEAAHGRIAGGRMAVLALGKLGGREMTAVSDLDLIVVYDFDEKATASDGKRPLSGGQYFIRLTQRFLAALTSPTAEGALYPVDFRLRPSGKSGPLATHIGGFAIYQAEEAWTWEHMALTRARAIAGDDDLIAKARATIASVIRAPRGARKLVEDIVEMRARIEAAKGGEGAWDIKISPGGLVDIEFIAQYLQLAHAAEHPEIVSTETAAVLAAAARTGLLPASEADIILPALRLYQSLVQVLRLCVDGQFRPEEAPRGLLDRLAQTADLPDFQRLDAHLRETENAVRGSFERLIGKIPSLPPA